MRHRALSAEELATVGSLSDSSGELVPAAAAPALRPSRALDAQAPRASRGIARVASTAPPLARSRGQSDAVSEAELASAAERARERRELNRSAIGRLQLAWEGLPRPARGTLILVVILAGLGGVASIVVRLLPEKTSSRAEVMELVPNSPALADGFGQGPGAEFVRPDQKTFVFKTTSPTQVVGVLHCQARNLSKDEVTVSLNGTELGALPADTLDIESREIEVVLPAAVLKPRDENLLLFDNLKNPPEKDDWLIWNTWVEIIPVPELSLELAVRRAKEEIEKAQRAYEYRDVASENLFRAWKTYREAWLLMEATPKAPKELHTIALTRMRELRPALDRRCSAMRLEFMRTLSQRPVNMDKARAALSDIPSFFPTREHPCLGFSQRLLRQLDDISDRVYTGPTGTDRN